MRNLNRSWWRRLWATLTPPTPDIAERLAGQYAAEIRLAHGLASPGGPLHESGSSTRRRARSSPLRGQS
jgi:hypothetical protein